MRPRYSFFFFNDTATTEIYTLSLHDALPIYRDGGVAVLTLRAPDRRNALTVPMAEAMVEACEEIDADRSLGAVVVDRKSTRLNSSHANISYAVFCLKKNNVRVSYHPTDQTRN